MIRRKSKATKKQTAKTKRRKSLLKRISNGLWCRILRESISFQQIFIDPKFQRTRLYRNTMAAHAKLARKELSERDADETAADFIFTHAKWVYTDAEVGLGRMNDRIDKLLVFNSTALGLAFAGVRLVNPANYGKFTVITTVGVIGLLLLGAGSFFCVILKRAVFYAGPPSAETVTRAGLASWTTSMARLKLKTALSIDLAAVGTRIVNEWIARRVTVAAMFSACGVILLVMDAIMVARQYILI